MANIVFSFLGTTLDKGSGDKRWERWRPTVSLVAHPSVLKVDRIEMFVSAAEHESLAQSVAADVWEKAPNTQINAHLLDVGGNPWDFEQMYSALHDFALSTEFNPKDNYYVHLATGTHVAQICLFILTQSRHFPAKLVDTFMEHGAPKSEAWKGSLRVIDLELQSHEGLISRLQAAQRHGLSFLKGGIETQNAQFNTLIESLEKVGVRSSAPILLMGPTGAGKSQLAKRIYELRAQQHHVKGALVDVNCATLQGASAQSALFGHVKGAFTGANENRAGLLKTADQGVLFLDEIGELGLDEQAMLLKALEDKSYYPLGSEKKVQSNFMLIAGTNRDLAKLVQEGKFRADLYSRINLWSFVLPGLKDRTEDIEPNLDYECEKASAQLGRKIRFSQAAKTQYLQFALHAPWPGNFRDLAASVQRLGTLAESDWIEVADVQAEIARLHQSWNIGKSDSAGQAQLTRNGQGSKDWAQHFGLELDLFDKTQFNAVIQTLSACSSMAQAGRILFGVSRGKKMSTNDSDRVKKYLAKYNLTFDEVRAKI